jgi:glycosyltransferase involved in cell wall biosynthesis
MRVIAIHLFNDFSGSPKVLSQAIAGWTRNKITCHLYTSKTFGFLTDLDQVVYHNNGYRFSENKLGRLFYLISSQLYIFFTLLFKLQKEDIVYINTVLPFGAALAGKARGARVIYHIHETSVKPAILKSFLFGVANSTASDAIYVSDFLANQEVLSKPKSHVIHNALPAEFKEELNPTIFSQPTNVLMACSLKEYKGVNQFVELAQNLPSYKFRLVLNASDGAIDQWFSSKSLPSNIEVFPTQTRIKPHMEWADVLTNLSLPDQWVETFGLTVIEAKAFGVPAIVPQVGGVTEIVNHEVDGFQISAYDMDSLMNTLTRMQVVPGLYHSLAKNALASSALYSEANFSEKSLQLLSKSL